jgi:hypothetical protein
MRGTVGMTNQFVYFTPLGGKPNGDFFANPQIFNQRLASPDFMSLAT